MCKFHNKHVSSVEKVWLLTEGSGSDGDEWGVISIHATKEGAILAKEKYEKNHRRADGSVYHYDANIEEWELEA